MWMEMNRRDWWAQLVLLRQYILVGGTTLFSGLWFMNYGDVSIVNTRFQLFHRSTTGSLTIFSIKNNIRFNRNEKLNTQTFTYSIQNIYFVKFIIFRFNKAKTLFILLFYFTRVYELISFFYLQGNKESIYLFV